MVLTETLESIYREAAGAILEIYADERRFAIDKKADDSPLTEADRRSNLIILSRLAETFPGTPVISEEKKARGFGKRQHYARCFIVDPLDGTKEFIKRNGQFAVNIALVEQGHPIAAVVGIPVTGECYSAEYGLGAWRCRADGTRDPITARVFSLADQGLRVLASESHRDATTETLIARLRDPQILHAGSSIKFLRLAEGAADVYPRLAPTMEWDTAAPQLILEEAGGAVVRYPDLQPLTYNKPELVNPGFIAFGRLTDPERLHSLVRDS